MAHTKMSDYCTNVINILNIALLFIYTYAFTVRLTKYIVLTFTRHTDWSFYCVPPGPKRITMRVKLSVHEMRRTACVWFSESIFHSCFHSSSYNHCCFYNMQSLNSLSRWIVTRPSSWLPGKLGTTDRDRFLELWTMSHHILKQRYRQLFIYFRDYIYIMTT